MVRVGMGGQGGQIQSAEVVFLTHIHLAKSSIDSGVCDYAWVVELGWWWVKLKLCSTPSTRASRTLKVPRISGPKSILGPKNCKS